MEFVELERSFIEITEDQEPNLEIGPNWGHLYGGWLRWEELLRFRRVALLAEALSGKTEEFRNKATALNNQDRTAFFVAIENLADLGLQALLGPSEHHMLQRWLSSSRVGYFFLDSVDEARLNRRSFEVALKRLANEVDRALDRTHVFVSCRVSDWKEPEDRRAIETILRSRESNRNIEIPVDPEAALLAPIFDKEDRMEKAGSDHNDNKLDQLHVVQILPLDDRQRRILAHASGVGDVERFISEIQQQGLDELAERPGDLLELIDYWNRHRRFGPFAEMVQYALLRKLSERDKFRIDNDTLSISKAEIGAESVAGALTLCKSFTLRAPGHHADGNLHTDALDPASVLVDWTDAERNALLRLGVFAPSTYGRIRFHHRSIQEYLTAAWLHRMLEKGCPRQEIFDLVFCEKYGVETVVPSLRPAAAWLSLKHADIREEIVSREPLVLLRFGDPGSLPSETKERLLLTYAAKHAACEITDDFLELRSLWMFADKKLARSIRKAWHLNQNSEFRLDLIRLIGEGRISECEDLARGVALDDSAAIGDRVVALDALKKCGDQPAIKEYASRLKTNVSRHKGRLIAGSAKVLFPDHLTVSELVHLIARFPPPDEFSVDWFGYDLFDLWSSCLSDEAKNELAAGLADICLKKPYVDDYHRVSRKHRQTSKQLEPIAHRLAVELGDRDPPEFLVRLLMVVERAEHRFRSHTQQQPLDEVIRSNSKIHRSLFWADVEDQQTNRMERVEPTHYSQIFFGGEPLWRLSGRDLYWLFDDLDNRPRENHRRIALSAILNVLSRENRLSEEIEIVRSRVSGNAVLEADLEAHLRPVEDDEQTRQLRKKIDKARKKRSQDEEEAKLSWLQFRTELQADPSRLSNLHSPEIGSAVSDLMNVTRWLCRKTGSNDSRAAEHWKLLEEGFGSAVAEAYRDGMKLLWRITEPERPVRKKGSATVTKLTTILSISGIALEATGSSGWASDLSQEEAERATRHGCWVDRGYPIWLDTLLSEHLEVAFPVIRVELSREWYSRQETPLVFLSHFSDSTPQVSSQIYDEVRQHFLRSGPKRISVLDCALRIIQKTELDDNQKQEWASLAHQRFIRSLKSTDRERALRYLALLFYVAPSRAVDAFGNWLDGVKSKDRREFSWDAFASLFGRDYPLVAMPIRGAPVQSLKQLVHIAYRHVKPTGDRVREGPFTPDLRDKAEGGRNAVLKLLLDAKGHEAYAALRDLSDTPALRKRNRRLRELSHKIAERDAEIPAWQTDDVRMFERRHQRPALTGEDLFRIVNATLANIQFGFTSEDASSKDVLLTARDETAVQNWLAEQLKLRANERFTAFREPEVANAKQPDILISSTSARCEVALEVKHGGMRWTVRRLEDALINQLAENYLKPRDRRHGIFVITRHSGRTWRHPISKKALEFGELICHLKSIAESLSDNTTGPIELSVVGIDASKIDASKNVKRV